MPINHELTEEERKLALKRATEARRALAEIRRKMKWMEVGPLAGRWQDQDRADS